MNTQRGFTLIELVMVIVILGILSAVALPQFADLSGEAEEAAADGVYGATQAAAAINYSAALVGATQPAGAAISTGALLLAALDGTPDGWVPGTTDATEICFDVDLDADCDGADTYIITVATAEVADTNKAGLTKNW